MNKFIQLLFNKQQNAIEDFLIENKPKIDYSEQPIFVFLVILFKLSSKIKEVTDFFDQMLKDVDETNEDQGYKLPDDHSTLLREGYERK